MPILALALLLAAPAKPLAPGTWAEFRGPDGTGLYAGKPVVAAWGTDTNVAWKTDLPGVAWSSPVFVAGKLFLTNAVPQGEGAKPDFSLRALCIDPDTGKVLWDVELFVEAGAAAPLPHKKNSHASPTPVSDGEALYVHFGHMGTAKLDLAGKLLWKTQKFAYKPTHGNGGSPILVDGMLVFSCDGQDKQFVVALDPATGEAKWKTDRNMKAALPFSFATAHAIEVNGRKLIVSPASDFVAAYNASDGAEVWRVKYPKSGWSVIARPVVAGGLVIVQTGYVNQHLIAIDPNGTGDLTANVKWTNARLAPNTPTPLVVGDDLYVVSDRGLLSCFEPKTGTVKWSERLAGRGYSASPVLINGNIYITSEEGIGQVIKPDAAKLVEVSKSDLKERTFATFVPVDGALYVRTETKLYKFAK